MKAFALVPLLFTGAALAQPLEAQTRVAASPRTNGVELKLGTIRPAISSDPDVAQSYVDTFGEGGMLLGELEFDALLYQGIGTAGVALSVGYAEKYGRAITRDDEGNPVDTPEVTGFFVVPVRLSGVYRFDWAAHRYGIPLVPYVKAGLVVVPWWITKGDAVETVGDDRAQSVQFGYGGTVGLSLLLDWFEPRLARDFDADLGVNHSYLFAELTYADVNGFGGDGMDLSTRHFMFGLALEF